MPPPYAPAGRCIYCGSVVYSEDEPDRKLGEEHIIPLQLRGRLVLPEASCQACERLTTGFETKVTPLYEQGRYHLGITGRKRRKQRDHIPIIVGEVGRKEKVPLKDHPGFFTGFRFPCPAILLGLEPSGVMSGQIQIAPAVRDLNERVRRLGEPFHIKLGNGVHAEDFARMLAKIAFSYAVAENRIGNYEPLLLPALRGTDLGQLPWLIGSPAGDLDRRSDDEHEIGFDDVHPDYLVVRIRLFAAYGLAPYYVVVARKT